MEIDDGEKKNYAEIEIFMMRNKVLKLGFFLFTRAEGEDGDEEGPKEKSQ